MPTLVLGKLLNGITVTICHMAVGKMLSETIPKSQLPFFTPTVQAFAACGFAIAFGLGLGLPPGDYHPGLPKEGANLNAYTENQADSF